MDNQMGRIWKAINYRKEKFNEDWLLIITTDHGRDSATGHNHGGQSDRERLGWIATNAKDLNTQFKAGRLSIADIMPSIASFLHINIPKEDLMEVDGTSFIGKIGATDPSSIIKGDRLIAGWKKTDEKGNAKIWLATTNNYKTGAKDEYTLMETVPLQQQKAVLNISKVPSGFYKVVVETPSNYLNRWIVKEQEKK
jgi:hypothetical protein